MMTSLEKRTITRNTREKLLISMHCKGREETLVVLHRELVRQDMRMPVVERARQDLADSPKQNRDQRAYGAHGQVTISVEAKRQDGLDI